MSWREQLYVKRGRTSSAARAMVKHLLLEHKDDEPEVVWKAMRMDGERYSDPMVFLGSQELGTSRAAIILPDGAVRWIKGKSLEEME
jgi:hypothetical protein